MGGCAVLVFTVAKIILAIILNSKSAPRNIYICYWSFTFEKPICCCRNYYKEKSYICNTGFPTSRKNHKPAEKLLANYPSPYAQIIWRFDFCFSNIKKTEEWTWTQTCSGLSCLPQRVNTLKISINIYSYIWKFDLHHFSHHPNFLCYRNTIYYHPLPIRFRFTCHSYCYWWYCSSCGLPSCCTFQGVRI